MGNYINMRLKVKVKPEYREDLLKVLKAKTWENSSFDSYYKSFEGADSIPFGKSEYIPKLWKDTSFIEGYYNVLEHDNILGIQCSFKNSNKVLEHFMEQVLRKITDKIIYFECRDGFGDVTEKYTRLLPIQTKVKLFGEDGNIFNILCRVDKSLRADGRILEAIEVQEKVYKSNSYGEALQIIMSYVDIE